MALDFGKGNLSISLNPTSAFPMDARCYFESLTDAQNAAAKAKEVGDTTTVYHYGMRLLVKQGLEHNWYIITPSNTLISDRSAGSPIPRDVSSEAEMNAILASATETSIGTIYRFVGKSLIYEYGALYIISDEIPDGDEVKH